MEPQIKADSEKLMEAVVGRVLAGGDSVEERNNTRRTIIETVLKSHDV